MLSLTTAIIAVIEIFMCEQKIGCNLSGEEVVKHILYNPGKGGPIKSTTAVHTFTKHKM